MWYLAFISLLSQAETCRVLSISGGGSYGSYEAGAFKGLVDFLSSQEVRYNAVTGISGGALNSLIISTEPPGRQKAAIDYALSIWTNLNGSSSVYQNWSGGVVSGLLFHSGLFQTTPLNHTLYKFMKEIKRNVTVGGTNQGDGKVYEFNETLGVDGVIEGAMISSAIPAFFQNQHYNGDYWVDGGVKYGNDYDTSIRRCLDVTGGVQKDITIDMLQTSTYNLSEDQANSLTTVNVWLRALNIRYFDIGIHGLLWAMEAYPEVNFRYYIMPSKSLPGLIPLDFNQKDLNETIKIGTQDAQYVIQNNIYAIDVLNKVLESKKFLYP